MDTSNFLGTEFNSSHGGKNIQFKDGKGFSLLPIQVKVMSFCFKCKTVLIPYRNYKSLNKC